MWSDWQERWLHPYDIVSQWMRENIWVIPQLFEGEAQIRQRASSQVYNTIRRISNGSLSDQQIVDWLIQVCDIGTTLGYVLWRMGSWCVNDFSVEDPVEIWLREYQECSIHTSEDIRKYGQKLRWIVLEILEQLPEDHPRRLILSSKVKLIVSEDLEWSLWDAVLACQLDTALPEDYIHLFRLFEKMDNHSEALKVLVVWLNNTRSHALFELLIRFSSEHVTDDWSKSFFYKNRWEIRYPYPFSYARGIFLPSDNQDEIRSVVESTYAENTFWDNFPGYISSALECMDQIVCDHFNRLDIIDEHDMVSGDFSQVISANESSLIAWLEWLETMIYYLMDFESVTVYFRLLTWILQSQWGTKWLTGYFSTHPISILVDDKGASEAVSPNAPNPQPFLENMDCISADTPQQYTKHDISIHFSDNWDTLRPEVVLDDEGSFLEGAAIRCAHLRIFMYHPYLYNELPWEGAYSGLQKDIVIREVWDFIWEHLSDTSMSDVWEQYETEKRGESLDLQLMGCTFSTEYRYLIEEVDERIGVSHRVFLSHMARYGAYTWNTFPIDSTAHPSILYFFILERILGWNDGCFEGKLMDIIVERLDASYPELVKLLATSLYFDWYYAEWVQLLLKAPDLWTQDLDILILLLRALDRVDESQYGTVFHEEVNRILKSHYNCDHLRELTYTLYTQYMTRLRGQQSSGHEPVETEIILLGKIEYINALAFTGIMDEEWNYPENDFMKWAKSHGSLDAIFEDGMAQLWDISSGNIPAGMTAQDAKENVLYSFMEILPDVTYPLRADVIMWSIDLAHTLWDSESLRKIGTYIAAEWLDLGVSTMDRVPLGRSEFRHVFYSLYIAQKCKWKLSGPVISALLEWVYRDLDDPKIPYKTRFEAAFISTRIAFHRQSWLVWSYVDYFQCLSESFIAHSSDTKLQEDLIAHTQDVYDDFTFSSADSRFEVCLEALHFHAVRILGQFEDILKVLDRDYTAPDKEEKRQSIHAERERFFSLVRDVLDRFPQFSLRKAGVQETSESTITYYSIPWFWQYQFQKFSLWEVSRTDEFLWSGQLIQTSSLH